MIATSAGLASALFPVRPSAPRSASRRPRRAGRRSRPGAARARARHSRTSPPQRTLGRAMRPEDRAKRLDETYQPRLWLTLVVLGLLLAYVIYFIAANGQDVSVQFLFAEVQTSLIWVILLCLAIGIVAGVLLSQLYRRRRS